MNFSIGMPSPLVIYTRREKINVTDEFDNMVVVLFLILVTFLL